MALTEQPDDLDKRVLSRSIAIQRKNYRSMQHIREKVIDSTRKATFVKLSSPTEAKAASGLKTDMRALRYACLNAAKSIDLASRSFDGQPNSTPPSFHTSRINHKCYS